MITAYLADIPSPPRGVLHLWILPIRAYAFCIIIGIIVAVFWGNRRFVARGGRPGRVTDIAVFAVPFGLVGGRLYHVITDNELYFRAGRNPWNAFAIWDGGLGIWGAIALGGLGAWIGCRYYKVPLSAFADSVAPGIAVAQAIGRLGNYFNQELFGSPTTLPWGLDVFLRTPGGVAGTLAQCPAVPEFPTDYIKANPDGALRDLPPDVPVRTAVEPRASPPCWSGRTESSGWAAARCSGSTSPVTRWAAAGSRCCGSTRPTTSSVCGSTSSPRSCCSWSPW